MRTARRLTAGIPLDEFEDEIFFTRGTLKADPDAAEFLPMTDDWLGLVDATRAKDREARIADIDATAARVITNHHLDGACTAFGDDLYLAVGKERESPRWTQFFSVTVSRFIKMRFDKQVGQVKAWLASSSNDATLEKHRTSLTKWSNAAEASITLTNGVALVRGAARIAREQLAEDLTRERDGLYDVLSTRARERGLSRDWANQFFRVGSRNASGSDSDTPEPSPPPSPTP